jgi:tetratricopeptide (TPR) repeat protein
MKLYVNYFHAVFFETPEEEIKYFRQVLNYDDEVPSDHFILGFSYNKIHQYDKAIPEFKKALEIYKKWGSKPIWSANYNELGDSYHGSGQYKKEKKLYRKAEQDFPDNPLIIKREAVLALTEKDKNQADNYIRKYKSISKDNGVSEADISSALASVYSEAGISDIALEYYRMSLSLEPENPARMNSLAYFIFDNNRNLNEGMALVDSALKSQPENYSFLETKGWGLYKQGRSQEARQFLQKAWDLKPIYNQQTYLHLDEVSKAVGGQK